MFSLNKIYNSLRDRKIISDRARYWRNVFASRLKVLPKVNSGLTIIEKKEVKNFYLKFGISPNLAFHEFYKNIKGEFNKNYIPLDVYYTLVDPYFNNWELGRYLDNKTFYKWLFPDILQPSTVAYRQNGFWFDKNNKIVTLSDVVNFIKNEKRCFIKQANESEGGKNIFVVSGESHKDEILSAISSIGKDIIIQRELNQNPILSEIHPSSLNTIRLLTLLRKDGSVKLCSSSLRMGVNGSKVDNASSGGITVGVNDEGRLNSIAYSREGKKFEYHPNSKVKFANITIPKFPDIVELVKNEQKKQPNFRLISWDIALTDKETPVLVEANLYYGGAEIHQLNNGPVFGDDTEDILNEIFS